MTPTRKRQTGSTAPGRQLPAFSADQLTEALRLIKGADSVELKLSVPDGDRRSAVAALGMDPLDAQIRQVFFLDTPDLVLNGCGVVLRARRVQRKPADSVVKLRPVLPDQLPPSLRNAENFGVEVDAMPDGFVCSGSMKAKLDDSRVTEALAAHELHKLFTKEQRALFAEHVPDGVQFADLAILGPINVLKLKFTPGEYGRRLVAELWFYPDGSRILELSTKCAPTEALQVVGETKAFLGTHGIDLFGHQQTKTKTALEFFARELADPVSSPGRQSSST